MDSFFLKLNQLKAYRKDREELAQWVTDGSFPFDKLLQECRKVNDDISFKAAWILELVCIHNMSLLIPYLDNFIVNLPKIYKHQAVRPMAKICEQLLKSDFSKTLTLYQKEKLVEICFDWLISDQKVAAKAYAMHCLYELGKDFEWIHPELKNILLKDFETQQPAFKAWAKNLLKKL